jgi:hypothetical protein
MICSICDQEQKHRTSRRDLAMFKFRETFDRLMAAITFAQANEHEIALDIMHDRPEREHRRKTEDRVRRSEDTRPEMRM